MKVRTLSVGEILKRVQSVEGKELVRELEKDLNASHPQGFEFYEGQDAYANKFEGEIALGLAGGMPYVDTRAVTDAVTGALFEAAGADGQLTQAEVTKSLGPQGLRFFSDLQSFALKEVDDPLADRRQLESLTGAATDALIKDEGSIAPEMKVFNKMLAEIGKPGEFDGFEMLGLQHLFASSIPLFRALGDLGVDFTRLLGKIYSTNFRVAAELDRAPVDAATARKETVVDPLSRRLAPGADFNTEIAGTVENHIRKLIQGLPKPPEKDPEPCRLIVDDGGDAIEVLHEKFPEYAPYFTCVEQTRRGARKVHELEKAGKLKCTVVNVAESWAKLESESPMIGHSVVQEIGRKLDRVESYGIRLGNEDGTKEAVVIGYGSVGRATAESLRERGYTVHVYDHDPERLKNLPEGVVGHNDLGDALPHANVLVSCVGTETLTESDTELIPDGAVLVNAASSNDELNPGVLLPFSKRGVGVRDADGDMWTEFQGKPLCLGYGAATAHSDTLVRHPATKKEFLVVNNGYVVNMTGERDPIPPRYIQLTRTLLLLGAIWAKRNGKARKCIDVPMDWQRQLVAAVDAELAQTGESLQDPSWEKHDPLPKAKAKKVPHALREQMLSTKLAGWNEDRDAGFSAMFGEAVTPKQSNTLPESGSPYAVRLGAVKPRTHEADIDRLIGNNDGELTPVEVGLHRAIVAVNRHFGAHMRVSMRRDSVAFPAVTDGKGSKTDDKKFNRSFDSPKEEIEQSFGHYVVSLSAAYMQRHNLDVTVDSLAEAAAEVYRHSSVAPDVFLDTLRASEDAADNELAEKLGGLL